MSKERSDETMTQNLEDLPMSDDELDIRRQAVNKVAAEILPMLLADLEKANEDKDLREQYEVDFLGDLYARMVVSVYMGYYPSRMADDAEDAALKLFEMAKEHDNDTD
jgi:hypothetical protein